VKHKSQDIRHFVLQVTGTLLWFTMLEKGQDIAVCTNDVQACPENLPKTKKKTIELTDTSRGLTPTHTRYNSMCTVYNSFIRSKTK
jgi:hypothetical protein